MRIEDERDNPHLPSVAAFSHHDLHDGPSWEQNPLGLGHWPSQPSVVVGLDRDDCDMGPAAYEPRAVDRLQPQPSQVDEGSMSAFDGEAFAVCLGFDALRLARGRKPRKFTPMQIVGLLRAQAEKMQPLRFHPDILACHAEFGGDLADMQRRHDEDYRIPTPNDQEGKEG